MSTSGGYYNPKVDEPVVKVDLTSILKRQEEERLSRLSSSMKADISDYSKRHKYMRMKKLHSDEEEIKTDK